MPTKMTSTGITFPDLTTQSTAGGPVTTLYAIGSYIIGRPATANSVSVNTTIAGSSLHMTSINAVYGINRDEQGNFQSQGWEPGANSNTYSQSVVNTGSWRCVSTAHTLYGEGSRGIPGLWVRYA